MNELQNPFRSLGSYIVQPKEEEKTNAILSALRNVGGAQAPVAAAPQQMQPGMASANSPVAVQQLTSALAPLVKKGAGYLGNQFGASNRYGTDMFSQQNNMLAAQDVGMF